MLLLAGGFFFIYFISYCFAPWHGTESAQFLSKAPATSLTCAREPLPPVPPMQRASRHSLRCLFEERGGDVREEARRAQGRHEHAGPALVVTGARCTPWRPGVHGVPPPVPTLGGGQYISLTIQ